MSDDGIAKKCCGLCPFSMNNTLFLHPQRAEDFAYMACNPYSDFVCHKTGISQETEYSSEIVRGEKSITCHGFAALQDSQNRCEMKNIDPNAFSDPDVMIDHHTEHSQC